MTRLTLSRSLTLCKVRYSVQLAGVTPTLALCFSMSLFLTSFPLESGCKGTHFFRFCKYHAHFFSDFFHTLVKIRCKTIRYAMHFFSISNPDTEFNTHYYIYYNRENRKMPGKNMENDLWQKDKITLSEDQKGEMSRFSGPSHQKILLEKYRKYKNVSLYLLITHEINYQINPPCFLFKKEKLLFLWKQQHKNLNL